jgi:hypothetical protein
MKKVQIYVGNNGVVQFLQTSGQEGEKKYKEIKTSTLIIS